MKISEQNRSIYHSVAVSSSRKITREYSTSFSLSILLLDRSIRDDIHSIYAFVRLADEIVDTFLDQNRYELLNRFRSDTCHALERGLSLNPVIHSFQDTARQYDIPRDLIEAFFRSMQMDLDDRPYNRKRYEQYIYGSAEVVGLMCLKVFCNGNHNLFRELETAATRLGAAFQKVNFLRDLDQDLSELERSYFPQLNGSGLNRENKMEIENEIEEDFRMAYEGIVRLPLTARFGVYTAYVYYSHLLRMLKRVPPEKIYRSRIRISGRTKLLLLCKTFIRHKTGRLVP